MALLLSAFKSELLFTLERGPSLVMALVLAFLFNLLIKIAGENISSFFYEFLVYKFALVWKKLIEVSGVIVSEKIPGVLAILLPCP